MKTSYNKIIFFLSLAGLLFSGYLSAIKFFTSTCAFNEPCPYFFGYPACYFGFGMFVIIFFFTILGLIKTISDKNMSKILSIVSFVGIIFAGYFTIPEIQKLLSEIDTNYSLILPTCSYGLIFYIIIFIISTWYLRNKESF